MIHGFRVGGSLARAVSAVAAMGLAVLAVVGATVDHHGPVQEVAAACEEQRTCCSSGCGSMVATKGGAPAPVYCFDPDNPPSPEIMEWIESLHDTGLDFELERPWGTGAGTPVQLTWSFVPDGTMLPGLGNQPSAPSNLFAGMNQKFSNNQQLWIGLIQDSFDRWAELTGIRFQRVTFQNNEWDDGASFLQGASSTRGHIRIGMRHLDQQGGVLAFAYYPPGGNIVLDAFENWQSSGGNYRFLRNVMMHEIGHSLGMRHCCPFNRTKLMEPAYSNQYDGPQHDDVRGMHVYYGDYYTPNNSIGTATNLGSLEANQILNPSVAPLPSFPSASLTSIDRLQDQDWFRFNITDPLTLNVTVTPVGHSYQAGPQVGNCNTGSWVDSRLEAALAVQVFGPNTMSLVATADGNPAGQEEKIEDLMLTEPGNYYVRVFATSSSGPQFYRVIIEGAEGPGNCPTITQQPSGTTMCEGGPWQFSVQATGDPAPTFQWRRNGTPIQGATERFLMIQSVTAADAGEYDCVVSNPCGSETSDVAVLIVNTKPVITKQPQGQTVEVGAEVSLVVEATGTPTPTFRWYKDNELIQGQTSGTLHFQSVTEADSGTYHAEAISPCGATATSEAILTVETACYANCDGSTTEPILTVDDFTCFINAFAEAQSLPVSEQIEHYANCDGSTTEPILTVDDFTCFINAFAQGCP